MGQLPLSITFIIIRMANRETSVTTLFGFVVAWVILPTFNFGFGTSELNPLQSALTCPVKPQEQSSYFSSPCIEITNAQFGYVTAAFTVGGLLGSLCLTPFSQIIPQLRTSRKSALTFSGFWNVAGGLVQAFSSSWPTLAFGRLLMGIGSGIALVIVPGYLNDLSPPALQGSIGVLNQLSIVIGILSAQALGVSNLGDQDANGAWRFVPIISSLIALIQLLLSPFALESPSNSNDSDSIKKRLWYTSASSSMRQGGREVEDPLLTPEEPDADTGSEIHPEKQYSISSLLKLACSVTSSNNPAEEHIRKGIRMIIFTQMAQQLSGINAVLYYSTGILSDVIKDGEGDRTARWIGLGITVMNFLMTFPPIHLIDEKRLGRKGLLQVSSSVMAISALVLGFSLLQSNSILAAISIVTFTAGFSAGLGPIPFLILPELVPSSAGSPASGLGIACNWIANITLATIFLPLKDLLGGSVFFLFVIIDSIIFITVTRYYSYTPPRQD